MNKILSLLLVLLVLSPVYAAQLASDTIKLGETKYYGIPTALGAVDQKIGVSLVFVGNVQNYNAPQAVFTINGQKTPYLSMDGPDLHGAIIGNVQLNIENVSTTSTGSFAGFTLYSADSSVYAGQGVVTGAQCITASGQPCTTLPPQPLPQPVTTPSQCDPASGRPCPVTGDGQACVYNGVAYAVGSSWQKDCNTCSCTDSGRVVCSMRMCPDTQGSLSQVSGTLSVGQQNAYTLGSQRFTVQIVSADLNAAQIIVNGKAFGVDVGSIVQINDYTGLKVNSIMPSLQPSVNTDVQGTVSFTFMQKQTTPCITATGVGCPTQSGQSPSVPCSSTDPTRCGWSRQDGTPGSIAGQNCEKTASGAVICKPTDSDESPGQNGQPSGGLDNIARQVILQEGKQQVFAFGPQKYILSFTYANKDPKTGTDLTGTMLGITVKVNDATSDVLYAGGDATVGGLHIKVVSVGTDAGVATGSMPDKNGAPDGSRANLVVLFVDIARQIPPPMPPIPAGNGSSVPPAQPPSNSCSNGCLVGDRCVPIGTRMANGEAKYCGIDGNFSAQLQNGAACQNNYECASNQCINAVCGDLQKDIKDTQGLIASFMNWWKSHFGG